MEAARGTRETPSGREGIDDPSLVAALKRRAGGVVLRVVMVTAVGAAVLALLPAPAP